MSTGTASWVENQTGVNFDDTSPADSVTATASIDLAASGYDMIIAQIIWTYHSSAASYVDISLRGDVNSGSNPSDIDDWAQRVDVGSDAGTAKELNIYIKDVPYVDILFTNETGEEISSLDLIYAGRKWDIS